MIFLSTFQNRLLEFDDALDFSQISKKKRRPSPLLLKQQHQQHPPKKEESKFDCKITTMNSSMPKSAILGGLPIVGAPTDIDVVFGRGGFANRHEGNKRYLELIGKHEKEYLGCQRKYQKLISMCIIHQLRSQVRQALS